MDNTDLLLLDALRRNARASLKEIAARIHLSIPATSERLRKLESSGVIKGYSVQVNEEMFGGGFMCFCFITLGGCDAENTTPFFDYVNNHPDIRDCYRIAGSHEYLVRINTESTKSLEKILVTLRDDYGVIKTDTSTVLSVVKEGMIPGGEIDR